MPFYEYECSACKFYVEALQKISDPPIKKCPSCKKQTMKKLVSAPAFRLAGGGWYETDFKSDKENKRNLVGEEKESTTDAKPADAKPSDAKAAADSKPDKSEDKSGDKSSDKSRERSGSKSHQASKKSTAKPKTKPKPAAKKK